MTNSLPKILWRARRHFQPDLLCGGYGIRASTVVYLIAASRDRRSNDVVIGGVLTVCVGIAVSRRQSFPPKWCWSGSDHSSHSLQYYDATILLHRPQISASEKATDSQSTSETTRTSLDKCIKCARDICRILVHYRRRYGLQRIHCSMVHVTMTASLIHVFHLYLSDAAGVDDPEARGYFSTCIQALGEMGQTYKSALRAMDVLLSLRQNWQYAASTNPTSKKLRCG